MKPLKYASFGLLALLCAVMTCATVLEKFQGPTPVRQNIYGAWWFALLWAVSAMTWAIFLWRRKVFRRPVVSALHLSFLLILGGAALTWLSGKQGFLHLRIGDSAVFFENREGHAETLPFRLRLDAFSVKNYPGTQSPMDYVSQVSVFTDSDSLQAGISMNRILRFKGYRFYQASYDADLHGSTLAVSHDPWGIGLTYAGYGLLLLSMLAFFFDKESGFRALLDHPALKKGLCCCALLLTVATGSARTQVPPALPRNVADELGNLHVYYNGRICPLATLAHDFCLKLTKKDHYKGYDANQFLSGWLFFHDAWIEEPMMRGEKTDPRSRERLALARMIGSQDMLRIFPYFDEERKEIRWAAPTERLPACVGADTAVFIRLSIDYLDELAHRQEYDEAVSVIRKIGLWQQRQAGEALPSRARFAAEKFYNRANRPLPVAVFFLTTGLVAFFSYCRRVARQRPPSRILRIGLLTAACAGAAYLSVMLGVRAWVSGHWPMANGYETMQMIAWFSLLVTLFSKKRWDFVPPFGFLTAGLAMMVSTMGASNPQITPLMPVLASPLLSVHVMLMMISYTLFAFMMLNGAAGLSLNRKHKAASLRLAVAGRLMLYPAVFTLAAGIFVGAVWANVSWGRYWGWDPKETWALITLLVYSFALHARSLPRFGRPAFFHAFAIAAFLCVIITYFGVNFLLGGMHAYV